MYTLGSVAFYIAIGHIQNKYIEKIQKLKKENNWMQYNDKVIIDSNFYKEIKKPSMFWFIIPLGITVATVYLNYIKGINDKIFLPLVQLIITLVSIAVFIGILNAKQNINSKMPNQSKKQSIFFRKIYLYYVILRSIFINILIMVIDLKLFNIITISNKLMMIIQFTILMMLYVIENILGLKYGQGGDRIKVKATEDGYITGERNDDEHWIFGNTMYYNSKDPSLWIEKRIGVGWTINAGNPIGMAIWIGSLVVLFMILTSFF